MSENKKVIGRKENDDQDAQRHNNLGLRYEAYGTYQFLKFAVDHYRKAAELGFADAQCNLGRHYEEGAAGFQDVKEAVRWYRLAVEQGSAKGQFFLGDCYEQGTGVDKNQKEAVRLYRLAADQGFPGAQYRLGICYHYRHEISGVNKDINEAVRLYRLAAKQNYAPAINKLSELSELSELNQEIDQIGFTAEYQLKFNFFAPPLVHAPPTQPFVHEDETDDDDRLGEDLSLNSPTTQERGHA